MVLRICSQAADILKHSQCATENDLAWMQCLRYRTALRFQRDRFVEGESMSRRLGKVCAATLLLAVVGCSAGSFLLSWPGANGKQQILSGSVQDVAERLQVELGKIHVVVAVNPMDNGTIRLNGQTKSGQRFSLVLKRHATSRGEQTALSVEWEKDADEEFWASVLDVLVRPAPVAPTSPDGINAGR
jgi:hypothetical protein